MIAILLFLQEIDYRTKQIEDMKSKLDGAQRKVERSDGKFSHMEKEKNQLIRVGDVTFVQSFISIFIKYLLLMLNYYLPASACAAYRKRRWSTTTYIEKWRSKLFK